MKIFAFIQMYNELSAGNLERCLNNCKLWADDIIIYDDKSTDDSVNFARKYTQHIILGEKNEWTKETFHKQQMLDYIHNMDKKPDWLLWVDCDEILGKNGVDNLHLFCNEHQNSKYDSFALQQINLWRGEKYYRTDKCFYGKNYGSFGWFVRLWKYTPELTMSVGIGSDRRLYPVNLKNITASPFQIIHYGFSNFKNLMKHIGVHDKTKEELISFASGDIYIKYVAMGWKWAETYVVNGKGIPNMFLDETTLTCEEVPEEWFPCENIPKITYTKPEIRQWNELISYNEM